MLDLHLLCHIHVGDAVDAFRELLSPGTILVLVCTTNLHYKGMILEV